MARARPAPPQYTIRDSIPHFQRFLRSEDKSPKTIETYIDSTTRFTTFAEAQGAELIPDITPLLVREWMLALSDAGNTASGRFNRWNGLKAFLKWSVLDGLSDINPMQGMTAPKPELKPIPVMSEAQLKALITTCSKSKDFDGIRDHAIIRLLIDTGMRRAELVGIRGRFDHRGRLDSEDLDLDANTVRVMGKGRKLRLVPFGGKTSQALYRYLRIRQSHPEEARLELWLGKRGVLQANGLLQMLRRRGQQAGIDHLWTHVFRHTAAHSFLTDGAQEQDVMRLLGWTSRDMLARYAAATADDQARAHYRSPGDRL